MSTTDLQRRARRLVLAAAIGLTAGASFSTVAAQQAAAPAAVDPALAAYASTKDSVRLADGRTIHLVCMGHGSPVVILTAGAGDWSISWDKVQPAIAQKTRVCAWDRPGVGFSTAPPTPERVGKRTTDLQAALKRDRIAGPYVVVGHSLGGYESLLLKDREPSKVVGMVLVDPSVPGQAAMWNRVAPAAVAWDRSDPPPVVLYLQKCVAAVRAGTLRRGAPDPNACLRPPPWPPTYPPELRDALDKHVAEATPKRIADTMDSFIWTVTKAMNEDSRTMVRPSRNFGSMPLIVLTAEQTFSLPSDVPVAVKAETPVMQTEWGRAHDALAALSTRGVNRTVAGTTHYIQQVKPQAVIDAVDEVLDEARPSGQVRVEAGGR
jgi:pimeloyl-ACP methyl ester carboxylesterase